MSAEFAVDATPDTPAGRVWWAALRHLLGTVEEHLAGTLRRRDPEDLHDLRVAVRRSRTVVRFGTGILPEAEREHLRTELGWLGGQTSLARDLDVHLIGLDEMADAVADPGALTPFAVLLGEQREQAHRELEAALSSPRFEALVAVWRQAGAGAGAKGAERPVGEVADEVLAQAAARVRVRGRALTTDSPAQDLHDLRKRAKELRYLIDMLTGADRRGAASAALPALTKLQTTLGRHQDATAQAQLVAAGRQELRSREVPAATLTALDELVAHLDDRAALARAKVLRRWATFDRVDRRTWPPCCHPDAAPTPP